MPHSNTPPSSPRNLDEIMEDDDNEEEDIVEVIDIDDTENAEENESDSASSTEEPPPPDISKMVFSKHHGPVFCCSLEPKEGTLAVTGGQDDRGLVWNIESGEIVLECNDHHDSVTHVEFNHDGTYVATGDISGTVQVWKLATKACVWKTQVGDIVWLKWHHGANVLVAGTLDGDVYVWKIPSGETKVLPGHGSRLECGVIMPDGKRCVVTYRDSSIKVFDMKSTSVIHHIKPVAPAIDGFTCIDAHNDNIVVIAGTYSGQAVLITTQSGKVVGMLNCSLPSGDSSEEDTSVESVAFYKSGDLSIAATGSLDGTFIIWDTVHQSIRHAMKLDFGIVKLQWHKKKPLVFVAGLKGRIEVYDGLSGTLKWKLTGHSEDILDFCMNNSTLVSGSDDMSARVFSLLPLTMNVV
ncbi:angio-associated migratory cell protein isoform X2 [Anabrus simplex]